MPVTTPPTITALPTPPDPNDRSTFNARAYPWSVAQQTLATQLGAVASNVYGNAVQVGTDAAAVALAALDAAAVAADRVQTGLDAAATATDRVQTGLDRVATAADRVAVNGALASIADGPVTSVNGMTGVVTLNLLRYETYANRASLRSLTPTSGDAAVVEGLGLFVWESASTEPDDDESCFATATGRWLLQAAHWDLVDAWQLPEVEERDAYDEDEPLRFAASFAAKILTGSATCAIASVAATASASFIGTVTGAAVGDRVIATPPAELGATSAETGRLSYHACVSSANTVAIMLTNASAAAANTNAAVQTAWPITVIKS